MVVKAVLCRLTDDESAAESAAESEAELAATVICFTLIGVVDVGLGDELG